MAEQSTSLHTHRIPRSGDHEAPTMTHTPARETEVRPWGSFTVLEDLPHCKVKRLIVCPGHRLSLQLHHKRE